MSWDESLREDPWWMLAPVLAGREPEGDIVDAGNGVAFEPIESPHRNIWRVFIGETCMTTFDADDFTTTYEIGAWVEQMAKEDVAAAEQDRESSDEETSRPTYQ
jgi:hypothetical protein